MRIILAYLRNPVIAGRMILYARGFVLELKDTIEPALRIAIFAQRLRDSGSREHARRIRLAKMIADIANSIIAREVTKATSLSPSDPAHMTWKEVGDALSLSKSAAFTRYGKR